jgi:hypothetical protein
MDSTQNLMPDPVCCPECSALAPSCGRSARARLERYASASVAVGSARWTDHEVTHCGAVPGLLRSIRTACMSGRPSRQAGGGSNDARSVNNWAPGCHPWLRSTRTDHRRTPTVAGARPSSMSRGTRDQRSPQRWLSAYGLALRGLRNQEQVGIPAGAPVAQLPRFGARAWMRHGRGARPTHARDQGEQGRLADAGRAGERRPAAGANRHGDPVQDRPRCGRLQEIRSAPGRRRRKTRCR